MSRFRSIARAIFRNTYEAAKRWSSYRRDINSPIAGVNKDISPHVRSEILRKSRYYEQNSAIFNRILDLAELYGSGPRGLAIKSASADRGWASKADAAWTAWEPWGDLTSLRGFRALTQLVIRTWFVDGEVFALKTFGESGRPRIQLIESHRIGTPDGNTNDQIIDGVEVDAVGRPVAYYLLSEDRKTSTRLKAESIIHVFTPSRPGQVRGLPILYPCLTDLQDLDELHLLEIKAAKDNAATSKVIKTPSGEVSDDAALIGSEQTAPSQEDKPTYYRKVIGGETIVLQAGDEYTEHRPTRPSSEAREFWDYLTNKICHGIGVPPEIVFPGRMPGTLTRAILEQANTYFRGLTDVVASDFCAKVWEYVIASEVPGSKPTDWRVTRYTPPRSIVVDMGRVSAAMLSEFRAGARSLRSITELEGNEWQDVLRQKAEEVAFAATLATETGVPRQTILQLVEGEASITASAPVDPDSEAAAQGIGDVQAAALNGAQVASLLSIATQVATGQLPLETAKQMARAAFPLISEDQIEKIFAPLVGFEPRPVTTTQPATQPTTTNV